MSAGPQAHILADGRRLHLHHGPIDLIIEVTGGDVTACYRAATARFGTILTGLAAELPMLRRPVDRDTRVNDPVARRMVRAVGAHSGVFVTPMAAVAGSVADEVLAAILDAQNPGKVYVNNGGDVAFHLGPGQEIMAQGPAGAIRITADDPVRGIATSGWQGRSHSLGIADAVTVAAATAADADVAATLIANAVDLPDHPAIRRAPARVLDPDSDLGDRRVTTYVGALDPVEIATALARGQALASAMCTRGLIREAVLCLAGRTVHVTHSQGAMIDA
ncbi:hypothetical protein BOO69_08860 [Sulfitobacter alexandrii]|uniref:Uncharacterized protein n=1 Tax=Sulfitobacter alexandrii TaxID=1917485 RepID=A0A1J0WGS3_9RHOB|nr:UPF0280 family protein [Sulfitobacter alexandrii]APE43507.1 hypothetical protein BOO69_08860 [Sulfitobacter alexandrii]